MGRSRGRKSLRPSARAVPAGGRDSAALPGAVGIVDVSYNAGRVTDDAGAGGATPQSGPECTRSRSPLAGPPRAVDHLVLLRRISLGARARRAGDGPLQPPPAPLPCLPL